MGRLENHVYVSNHGIIQSLRVSYSRNFSFLTPSPYSASPDILKMPFLKSFLKRLPSVCSFIGLTVFQTLVIFPGFRNNFFNKLFAFPLDILRTHI